MRTGPVRGVALMLAGIIMGAVLMNMLIGAQLDNLTLANRSLQQDLLDAQQRLRQAREASEARKKQTVSALEVFLLLDPGEDLTDYDRMAVEMEVSKKVKDWLNPVTGQEVDSLDSLLIPRIVDNREIEANGNKYRLRTYLVVVAGKTTVYIKASRLKSGAVPG